MFVFWKIWGALLSCYFRFEIFPFALLPTLYGGLRFLKNRRRKGTRFLKSDGKGGRFKILYHSF